MAIAYIGLGSNLGDPRAQIEAALREIARLPRTEIVLTSSLYRTPPWGGIAQPDFVNAVAQVRTTLDAHALMRSLLEVERAAGRVRDGTRNGPRLLDLDLLAYDRLRLDGPDLNLPHPHLHERAFVLVPLAEIAPDLVIPGIARVDALLARIKAHDCIKLNGKE